MTKDEKPRLTKMERRMQQRAANAGRAKDMHEARLSHPVLMKETLPPPERGQEIHIGCSGWFYWHWKGGFYADDLPMNKWFSHYSDAFRTVELNAPFYSWPTVATVKSWLRQIGKKKFTYTVKACELITHVKKFKGTKTLVKDFGYIADLLGARMGCLLFQMPPSFHYTPARLKNILGQLEPGRRNVVEFRHKSWWNEDVYEAFRKANAIFCSCSGPGLPEKLIHTADDIYIRFHGREKWYLYDYSRAELAEWAQKIKTSRAKRVWVYFNNDRNEHAIKNARMLIRLLKK